MAEITDKSTSDSGMDNDDDDDEQSWIPLPQSTRSPNSTVPTPTQTPVANAQRTTKSTSSSSSSTSSSSSSSTKTASRGMTIQRRLETRVQLKSGLVDHPLDMFWKRFLWNAAVQLWTLEWQIRVGMGMVATGTCIKIFMMSTWYFWYPKMVLVSTLFVVAAIYLDMFQLHHMLDTLGKMLLHPDNIIPLLQRLDATGLRRLTLVFLLVPTWLEMKTLSFLSGIQAETNSLPYVIALSTLLLSSMLYWYRTMHTKPRECLYRGLVILYGVSLAISAYHLNLSRLPTLAAPFLSATGTLLITYQDNDMEWISRVLRHTLRLTLRDVLSSMSTKVSEDEMLQLAMLRWIADYWASMPGTTEQKPSASPPKNTTPSQGTNHHATSSNVPAPSTMGGHTSSESATAVPPQKQESLAPTGPSNVMPKKRLSASETLQRQNQVTWEELLPMLSIATDHMSSEIKELQPDSKPPGASKPIPSRPAPTAQNSAPSTQSVDNFRDMLLSLNVDERGAPAVQAYKKAVESFPPSRETACILSLRRCPAFLSVVLHILLGRPSFVLTTIVLLPFILLEYYRMVDWIKNCEQMKQMFGVDTTNKTTSSPFVPSALLDADPMVILLSGDSYDASHPPALLLVWNNMKGSVAALQVGLSAARCAQTTAVAVQFAGNVMSLLEFGQEIHQHGLWHGLAVMAKEAILLHTCSNDQPGGAKYTQAAMGAVQNAQRVINNVQTLAADEHVGRYVQPIAWVLTSLSGHGWLWTHQDNGDERKEESNSQPDVSSEENIPKGKASGNSSYQQGIVKNTNAVGPTVDNVVQDSGAVGVASVLDEIADSYGNRLISETEKNELLGRLSQVATKGPSELTLIQKTLEEYIVQSKIAVQKSTNPISSPEKLRVSSSAVMELTLAAYYRGLINQSEKAAFCERIANLSEEERCDPAVVGGMIRTLEAILDGDTVFEVDDDSPLIVKKPASQHTEGTRSTRSECQAHDEESCHTRAMDALPGDMSKDMASSERELQGETKEIAPAANSQATNDSRLSTAPSSSLEVDCPVVASDTENSGQQKSSEPWLRLGMATLGVLVGGVLLSTKDDRGEQSENTERNASRNETTVGSTVQVEEIERDEDDAWVSVQQ